MRMKLCLVVSVFLAAPVFAAAPFNKVPNALPGRYIAVLDADSPAAEHAQSMTRAANVSALHVYSHVLNGFSFSGTEQKALILSKLPGVSSVWEVPVSRETDTQVGVPDGIDRIDQRALPLNDTYTYTMYTTPVTIYIVDSGMDPRAEFGNRVISNINFSYNQNSSGQWVRDPNDYTDHGLPLNDFWHGTATAVVAAGAQNGVARFAKIANVRVLNSNGSGSADDIIAGINYVTQQRAARPAEKHVANASYTANFGTYVYPPFDTAYANSINSGVAWVFAAGNDNADACNYYPARLSVQHSGAMTVGASVPTTDAVASYSNQGTCVDIFAPAGVAWGDPGGTVAGGTSAAAPHVSGVFAIRWANAPTVNSSEIEGLIKGVGTAGALTSNVWPSSPNLLLYSLLPKRRAVGS
jgi:subtilisin family serine protease